MKIQKRFYVAYLQVECLVQKDANTKNQVGFDEERIEPRRGKKLPQYCDEVYPWRDVKPGLDIIEKIYSFIENRGPEDTDLSFFSTFYISIAKWGDLCFPKIGFRGSFFSAACTACIGIFFAGNISCNFYRSMLLVSNWCSKINHHSFVKHLRWNQSTFKSWTGIFWQMFLGRIPIWTYMQLG